MYDLNAVRAAFIHLSQKKWWEEAERKSKLCSYINFKDRDNPTTLVCSNLKRYNHSLLAKLMCGILPLEVEAGRYMNVKKELHFCTVCRTMKVKHEYHSLFSCTAFQPERSVYHINNITDNIYVYITVRRRDG